MRVGQNEWEKTIKVRRYLVNRTEVKEIGERRGCVSACFGNSRCSPLLAGPSIAWKHTDTDTFFSYLLLSLSKMICFHFVKLSPSTSAFLHSHEVLQIAAGSISCRPSGSLAFFSCREAKETSPGISRRPIHSDPFTVVTATACPLFKETLCTNSHWVWTFLQRTCFISSSKGSNWLNVRM